MAKANTHRIFVPPPILKLKLANDSMGCHIADVQVDGGDLVQMELNGVPRLTNALNRIGLAPYNPNSSVTAKKSESKIWMSAQPGVVQTAANHRVSLAPGVLRLRVDCILCRIQLRPDSEAQ